MDKGRGAGVTVGIDWPGQSAKFEGKAIGFDFNQTVEADSDAGRGDTQVAPVIPLSTDGGLVVTLEIRRDAWPSPPQFRGEVLNVKLMNDLRGATDELPSAFATVPVIVLGQKIAYGEAKQTVWRETLTCRILAEPTWSGFGYGTDGTQTAQPTNAVQSYSNKELWSGISKTFDTNGIIGDGNQRIRLFGVPDSSASEFVALIDTIGEIVAPYPGLKLRFGKIIRRSSRVCIVDAVWGLTTTKEDIERGGSYRVDDPQNLGSAEAITKVNALPALDATFVDRGLTIKTLNDGTTVYTRQGGLLSTKDDEEMPGTFLMLDTSDLTSTGQNTKVYDTTDGEPDDVDPPGASGLQVVGHRVVKKNRLRSSKLTIYGKDTQQQSLEQESSYRFDDPYGLTSDGAVGALDASPSTTSGFVNRGVTQKYRTHDHIMYVRRIGVRTTKEDREFPGTYTTTDPQGITTNRKVTTVHDTASPPADPTLTGLKVIATTPVQLTSAGTPQSETVFEMGKLDSLDRIRLPRQKTLIDSSGLQNVATRTKQWFSNASEPSAPDDVPTNNTVLIDYWDETIYPVIGSEPALYLRVFMYGTRTRQEDIERDRTSVTVDALDKYHRETTSVVAWTDTLSALETSVRDANRTNIYFDDARGQLIDSRHAIKSVHESGDDKLFQLLGSGVALDSLKGQPHAGLASINPAVYGNTAADIHINVQGIIVGGPGGFLGGRVMPVYCYRRRASARYRRRFTATEPSSKLFVSLEGKTNNATFCGRPAHSLMFLPARYGFAYDDIGNRTLIVDYLFESDSELFMNDGDLPDSGSRVSTGGDPLLLESGFFPATIFDATALLSWPADADFAVLTA